MPTMYKHIQTSLMVLCSVLQIKSTSQHHLMIELSSFGRKSSIYVLLSLCMWLVGVSHAIHDCNCQSWNSQNWDRESMKECTEIIYIVDIKRQVVDKCVNINNEFSKEESDLMTVKWKILTYLVPLLTTRQVVTVSCVNNTCLIHVMIVRIG